MLVLCIHVKILHLFASGYEKKGYENVKFAYEAIDVKKLIYIPVAYKQI